MAKLTDLDYWQTSQGRPRLDLDDDNDIKLWIEQHVDFSALDNCIEIGCYPGRYLKIFADKGVEVHGIDYIPNVGDVERLFKALGYRTGSFQCMDFHTDSIDRKYDGVVSLGFIEHFDDWERVFEKHLDLVSDNGMLILEVPNFRGWLQRIPRYLFDRDNFLKHNLKAMDMPRWIEILEINEFEILRADYLGGYKLWFKRKGGRLESAVKRQLLRILRRMKRWVFPSAENHPAFSSTIGVIARKRGEVPRCARDDRRRGFE